MKLLCALFALIAMLLRWPPPRWRISCRLVAMPTPWTRTAVGRFWLLAAMAALSLPLLVFAGGPSQLIVGFTVIGVGAIIVRLHRRAVEVRRCRQRRAEVTEAIGALAAELYAGVLPGQALRQLAADSPFLEPAAAVARLGGDVGVTLRAMARSPGAERLEDLAAGWEVSQRSGAPLARTLDRLCDSLRGEDEIQREIDAGLSPARATARLMAVLPLLGLGLGTGIGSDPIHILVGTVAGSLCLASGVLLACLGVIWVETLAARAARP